MTNLTILAENATRDDLYYHQPQAVLDALVDRVCCGYQIDWILKYRIVISVLITRKQGNAKQ